MKRHDRIILVGPAFPLRGGIAHFNESFCRALMDAGWKTEIVSFYLQYPALLFPGKSQKVEGPAPDGIKIHNWLSSINPLSWRRAAKKIAKRKPRYVIIRFWLPFMGPALGALAWYLRKKNIRVIGLIDNAIPHESRKFDLMLSNLFFKNTDAFFTLSESVADDLKVLVPDRPVATSPHPVYDHFGEKISMAEARQKLNLKADANYILFFGFVRPYKGLDLLIEALGKEKIRAQNIHLIVAGEFYESEEKYKTLIERLDLNDRILIFSDYIPEEKVAAYFCAVNLVAQTYRTATQSGVTQIAYHFERPMLVTDVGGLAEIVPDGKVGYVVKPQPDAIADALLRFFIENKEDAFSKAAAVEKERFSWSHFTHKFIAFANTLDDV